MAATQIILTESESAAIQALSQSNGQTPEAILHEAVAQFLAQAPAANRLAALRQARGIWQERQDLPDFAALRNEWDRS